MTRKSNPVYDALEAYYDTQYAPYESDEFSESDLIYDYGIPLEQRKSGILQKLETLLAEGIDLNDAPEREFPLMCAVRNHDPIMVRYLIKHGADCRKWLPIDEDPDSESRNWYLEAIDYAASEESIVTNPNKLLFDALFEIAYILVTEGRLQEPFTGHCLKISEDCELSLMPMKTLF